MALTRPIRIAHVLEATEGGTGRWLENVVLGLDPSRFRQTCICATRRDPAFGKVIDRIRGAGHEMFVIDMVREIRPFRDAVALFRLVAHFSRHSYDVVHAHSSKAGILARAAAFLARTRPSVYTPHGYAFLSESRSRPLYRAIERCARYVTDHVVAVSASEEAETLRLGYDSSAVTRIVNGVVLPEARGPLAAGGARIVGTVGNLRVQKDPETFVRACASLAKRWDDLRFVWCGMGQLEHNAKRLAEQLGIGRRFTFTGQIEEPETVLRSLAVFVLSSRYEGLSYALLEAMALGLPVVATQVPGNVEAITHMETGMLAPAGDPARLADAIAYVLENPRDAETFGRNARARVANEYQLARQLKALSALYVRLAGGGQ